MYFQNEKQKKFLKFLYLIHTKSLKAYQFDLALYTVTFLQLILIEISLQKFDGNFQIVLLPIGLFSVVMLCFSILEIIFGIIYVTHIPYLKQQIKLIKSILIIPCSIFLTELINNSESTLKSIGYLFCLLLLIIYAIIVNMYIIIEQYQLQITRCPLNLILNLTEIFLAFSSYIDYFTNMKYIIKLLAIIIVYEYIDQCYNTESILIKYYNIILKIYAYICIIVFCDSITNLQLQIELMVIIIGSISITISEILKYQIQKDHQFQYQFSFKNISQIIEYIKELLHLIEKCKEMIRTKNEISKSIISFLLQHEKYCQNLDCKAKFNSNGLQNKNQLLMIKPENYQLILEKIYYEAEFLLNEVKITYPQNFDLIVCSLNISMSKKDKTSCYQLIKYANQIVNDIRLQYYLYSLQKNIQSLDHISEQSIEGLKFDEIVIQFKSSIISTLRRIVEYWQQFQQQVLDLKKILIISKRISEEKLEIKNLWNKISNLQTHTTLNILSLYIKFLKFLNENDEVFDLGKKFNNMHANLIFNKRFKYMVGQQYNNREEGVVIVSTNSMNLGVIIYCNKYFANLFGYNQKQLIKNKINMLMPDYYGKIHDQFILKYMQQSKIKQDYNSRDVLGKHKNGYIFCVNILLKKSIVESDLKMMGIVKLKKNRDKMYMISDEKFNIVDVSTKFEKISLQNARKRDIYQLFPCLVNFNLKQIAFQRDNYLSNLQIEIRHKLYNTTIYIKQLKHQKSTGYKFTFQMSKINDPPIILQRQQQVISFQFTYKNRQFNGYHLNDQQKKQSKKSIKQSKSSIRKNHSLIFIQINYGVGIRPIRYFNSQYIRLDDWNDQQGSEFESNNQINEISKQINVIDNIFFMFEKHLNIILKILFGVYICLVVYQIIITLSITTRNTSIRSQNYNKYKTKYYVSEYIIYLMMNQILDIPIYLQSTNDKLLIDNIQNSLNIAMIDLSLYDEIEKLIFLKQNYTFSNLISSNQLKFAQIQFINQDFIILYILLGLGFLLIIFYYLNLKVYDHQLLNAISLFLNLEEASLKYVNYSCIRYMKQIQEINEDEVQDLRQINFQDENSIRKKRIRKIKNKNRFYFEDCLKMQLVLVIISIYLMIIILLKQSQKQSLQNIHNYSNNIININNYGSEIIINKINQVVYNKPFFIPTYNIDSVQYYPQTQKQFDLSSVQNFFNKNVCPGFKNSTNCANIQKGLLEFGVDKAFDTFMQRFRTNNFDSNNEIAYTVEVFFNYLSPIYNSIIQIVQIVLQSKIYYNEMFNLVLLISLLMLLLFECIIVFFELNKKKSEVSTILELVKLIPTDILQKQVSNDKIKGYEAVNDTQY